MLYIDDYKYDVYIISVLRFSGRLSAEDIVKIQQAKPRNSHSDVKVPMLKKTRKLLDEFYAPFNTMLAEYLSDNKFHWDN